MLRALIPLLVILAGYSVAQGAECKIGFTPITSPSALGYQDRGDRCEGLFVQPISTSGLRLVGYQWDVNNFENGASLIQVNTPSDGNKAVTIVSTRKRQYYRMDSSFRQRSFSFPHDLLSHPAIDLGSDELAVLACVDACDTLEPVLMPAIVATAPPAKPNPFIILQASSALQAMRIEISDRTSGKVLFDKQVLKSTWEPWRPAELPLGRFFEHSAEIVLKVTAQGNSTSDIDSIAAVLLAPPQMLVDGRE